MAISDDSWAREGRAPVFSGHAVRGLTAKCRCGELATHRASWIVTGGYAGLWEREDFCGRCLLAEANKGRGSWRVEPLPTWAAHCRARDKWALLQAAAANVGAQQRWEMP